ncbi:unnamed protein product [Lactuca virosa]|uniref:Uncharacterized protein n=1 Tax=Lactuca virosa TaxID=75947 RepID=A0AAU9PDY5_9ASTR|nr:unnamed protein product [Lactuca virosa]
MSKAPILCRILAITSYGTSTQFLSSVSCPFDFDVIVFVAPLRRPSYWLFKHGVSISLWILLLRLKEHTTFKASTTQECKLLIFALDVDCVLLYGLLISSTQGEVGRKVLADISNSQGNLQKNEAFNGSKSGKVKMEKVAYSQRASIATKSRDASSLSGSSVGSQSEAVESRVTQG